MDYQTNIKAEGNTYNLSEKLDNFWPLIIDMYQNNWHVDANGDLVLEVDEAALEQILRDNIAVSWYVFGVNFALSYKLPDYLMGEYRIKGIYDANQRFVNHARRYFFTQEGA